nr:hypothetical protein [Tanacetum cinerariifolium]
PQIDYAPMVQHSSEYSPPETGLVFLVCQKGDDPIDAINHMMSFLTVVVTSSWCSSGRDSSRVVLAFTSFFFLCMSSACNLPSSGFTFLLAVASFFTGSGKLFCQRKLYNWQWECLIVMANPNPEDPNVPNEDVLEEDPYHLLGYEEEEDPEMDIEEEEPKEDPVEETEPLAGHGDQFDAHPNPQPGNINGWVDDDDDVEEEDDENEDVDIEEDDDAEIIFPYEVQGDQTPPPRDESSDSDSEPEAEEADDEPEVEEADDELEVEEAGVEPKAEGADVELEAEEPDGVPEATIGTGSQRPFAVRDFPMGFYETGETSTARDPQFVGGLAPWALRRDLEALRRHERIREAESKTSRTETLGKVVERLKVLECEENAT